jgi:hypothetical protein
MAAVTSYATLTTRLSDEAERTYTSGETDGFIADSEAEFRIYLGPSFAKETSGATLAFTTGSATLPTGLVRVLNLSHATYGPLKETSLERIRALRINGNTTVPAEYTITGTTILTDATYTGNLTLDYEGTLTGLSSGNTTNWLVTYAPQAYVHMCMSFAKLREEDYQGAAIRKAMAMKVLDDLGIQSMVAQKSRAIATIPGATP